MAFMLDPKKFSDFPPEPTVDGSEIIPIVKDGQNSSVTVETLQQLVDVITDHGQLGGLSDDDHPQYALADGSRGDFATTGQGALADTALQNISGQDLSTADNTASAFITAADVPAETDPVFAASSAASITPTDITHLANLDSAAYEPSTAFAPALGVDDNYVTDAEKSNLHTHSNKTVLDNTTASFTTADETKLDGIAIGAQVNTVTSVNTRTGAVTGLAEASDLTAHTGNTSNPHSVTKAQVGLGNADNTSDAAKPISTATQTALDGKFTQRTITGTTNQVTVTNGDGVSGNPTLSLPQDIHTGASPTFAGATVQSASFSPLTLRRSSDNANGQGFRYVKSRGTIASPTGVLANDQIARFMAAGYIDDNTLPGADTFEDFLTVVATENFTATAKGRTLSLKTVKTGENVSDDRIILNGYGNICMKGIVFPYTDSTYTLGSSSLYWSNTYTDRLYLNSTAYLDGGTAGQINTTGKFWVGRTSVGNAQANTAISVYDAAPVQANAAVLSVRRGNAPSNGNTIGYGLSIQRISTDICAWYLGADTSDNAIFASNSSDIRIGKDVSGAFTEYMRILNANGNVGIGTTAPNEKLTVAGAISITDGITAPSATSGYAKIYVDTADGDLKVIFGDGTVKTIATDT